MQLQWKGITEKQEITVKKTIILTNNTNTKNNNEVFLINIADAKFVSSDIHKDYIFDDTNCEDIKKPTQSESTITANGNETTQGNEFYQFFSDQTKIELLEKHLNDELKKDGKSSVGVRIIIDRTFNHNNDATNFVNGVCKKSNQIRIKVLLSNGHTRKSVGNNELNSNNTKSDNIWLKSWGKNPNNN